MPPNDAITLYKEEYDRLLEISPDISKKILKQFNSTFKKNEDLSKPEICSKLDRTQTFQMSQEDRQKMIEKINHKPKNQKMIDTFIDLNGREPLEDEIIPLDDSQILDVENFENTGDNMNLEIVSDSESKEDVDIDFIDSSQV